MPHIEFLRCTGGQVSELLIIASGGRSAQHQVSTHICTVELPGVELPCVELLYVELYAPGAVVLYTRRVASAEADASCSAASATDNR
jgi:hypothetical protein